jgi:hypothetical protein
LLVGRNLLDLKYFPSNSAKSVLFARVNLNLEAFEDFHKDYPGLSAGCSPLNAQQGSKHPSLLQICQRIDFAGPSKLVDLLMHLPVSSKSKKNTSLIPFHFCV